MEALADEMGKDMEGQAREGENIPTPPDTKEGPGGNKPPDGPEGPGGEGPMEPDKPSPWIHVPDNWLDNDFAENAHYRTFQEYFDAKVKPEIIDEHILGNLAMYGDATKIKSVATEIDSDGKLSIQAELNVTGLIKRNWKIQNEKGEDTVVIARSFDRKKKLCNFDWLSSSKVELPDEYGREYYKRAIPFLRKLGIERLETEPLTTPEKPDRGNAVGAYVWSFYGYRNSEMENTLEGYIDYLRNIREIKISPELEKAKLNIKRMRRLAIDKINGEETGRKYLLGYEKTERGTRVIKWKGYIPDINEEGSNEMRELIEHLTK